MFDGYVLSRTFRYLFIVEMFAASWLSCLPWSNYLRDGDTCVYRASDEGDLDGTFVRLNDCDAQHFESLSRRNYARDEDTVWYKFEAIPGADAATFEVLPSPSRHWPYARDRNRVYFEQHIVLGADPKTFHALRLPYSRDRRHTYCGTLPLELAGPNALRVVKSGWTTVGSTLQRMLEKLSYSATTRQHLLDRFGRDTWVVASSDARARAGDQIYLGCALIRGADPSTFEFLEGGYARDAHAVYWRHSAIPGADPQSFEVLRPVGFSRARDANRSYEMGRPQ